MLLPSSLVLAGLGSEFGRLQSSFAEGEASAVASINISLRLLAARERGDTAAMRRQSERLAAQFRQAVSPIADHASLRQQIVEIQSALARGCAGSGAGLQDSESAWRDVLGQLERFAGQLANTAEIEPAIRTRIGLSLNSWEIEDLTAQLALPDDPTVESASTEITAAGLSAYLSHRFNDAALEVVTFKPLPGGFGKQTFLFEVKGAELNGEFVMRRDPPVTLFDNDCHRGDVEYQLIRALHERGFPAPEALWLDTEHRLLPGGDFIVMRRSPGVPGGSVFQATSKVPENLSQTLADIMARLHALAPMPELSSLTDSINAERWAMPLDSCVRLFLQQYQSMFEQDAHLPSPALVSLFGWLQNNVPALPGKPVLLHGDIGFHNFLFSGGELSAVLDWEFAHLGDPAEDLAYVRNTVGAALDWDAFMAAYRAAGGVEVSAERLHFFQVWGQVRNICSANLAAAKFATGQVADLKMVLLPHAYIPQFLTAAQTLIEQGATR